MAYYFVKVVFLYISFTIKDKQILYVLYEKIPREEKPQTLNLTLSLT